MVNLSTHAQDYIWFQQIASWRKPWKVQWRNGSFQEILLVGEYSFFHNEKQKTHLLHGDGLNPISRASSSKARVTQKPNKPVELVKLPEGKILFFHWNLFIQM